LSYRRQSILVIRPDFYKQEL